MSTEDYLARPGDTIRLRSGPYAGDMGMVVSVHPDENHVAENSLVMVKLMNGKINSCYMSNLEKIKVSPDNESTPSVEKGGQK
jgi:hypothetical protein